MKNPFIVLMVAACFAGGCAGQPAQGGEQAAASPAADAAPAGPPPPVVLDPVVPGTAPENPYSDEQIARGGSLVAFGGCNDCHTPWVYDAEIGGLAPLQERMLSGHPAGAPGPYGTPDPRDVGIFGPTMTSFGFPFGVVYALNLTPDTDTGTGTWTEEMFLKIFREAKHLGGDGRSILPPMPWFSVASLPDEDIVAIFAYLRSIPPVRNAVPSSTVPQEVLDAIGRSNEVLLKRLASQQ